MGWRAANLAWVPLLLVGCASGLLAGCASGLQVGSASGLLVGSASGGGSGGIECAPYARMVSGIQLHGDAASWWDAAAGRYQRARQPDRGSVLVFRRSARLPAGHVSTVTAVRSPRDIVVNDANWVHGQITRDEPVLDVSPANDWSAVRVWWAPAHRFGGTVYPTYGFIRPIMEDRPMW